MRASRGEEETVVGNSSAYDGYAGRKLLQERVS